MEWNGVLRRRVSFLGLALFGMLCLCSASSGAIVDCTVSGAKGVVVDTNEDHIPNPGPNPTDDASFVFDFDDKAKILRVYAEGGVGIYPDAAYEPYPEAWLYQYKPEDGSFKEIANLDGVHSFNEQHKENMLEIRGSAVGGANLNHLDIFGMNNNGSYWKAGDQLLSADLVDSDKDGIYDRYEAEITLNKAHPWVPNVIFDQPLEFYPAPPAKPEWLVLPEIARVYRFTPFEQIGPFDLFIPLDGQRVALKCGENLIFQVFGNVKGGLPGRPFITVKVEGSRTTFSWTEAENADGYWFIFALPDFSLIDWFDVGGLTGFYVDGLPSGFSLFVAVIAYNEAGFGDLSNIGFFKIP